MNNASLVGKSIVITGRLASMSRVQARETILEHGGTVGTRVSALTDYIVVGSDGWPLRGSGKLTSALERAERLRQESVHIDVITETSFLRLVGLDDSEDMIRRKFTIEQLSRMLNISGLRLRRWVQAGILEPVDADNAIPAFDFAEVTKAKMIDHFLRSGKSKQQAAESLDRLRRWIPEDDRLSLHIHSLIRSLAILNDDGLLVDEWGQLHLNFEEATCSRGDTQNASGRVAICLPQRPSASGNQNAADKLFDWAFSRQQLGDRQQSAALYERWLAKFGSDALVLFNLGNVYADSGRTELAAQSFHESVQIEPSRSQAWNNLALCRVKLADPQGAISALRYAIELEPTYADAIYNLADILDECGRNIEAKGLWQEYVVLDPHSAHAMYARSKISQPRFRAIDALEPCPPMGLPSKCADAPPNCE